MTGTQPQRRPRLQGNPGKPRATGAPPRGGEKGGQGGDTGEARLCPSLPPLTPPRPAARSSCLPLSHAPNQPGLFPTHQPRPGWERDAGLKGSQTAPASWARALVAVTLVLRPCGSCYVPVSLLLSLSRPPCPFRHVSFFLCASRIPGAPTLCPAAPAGCRDPAGKKHVHCFPAHYPPNTTRNEVQTQS